jgi:iron complex outermembrane receptor protein
MSVSWWRGSVAPVGAAIALCSSPAVAQNVGEHDFNLPAQELALSLREVAARTGRNLVAPSDLLTGRRAPPIVGRYSAEGAMEHLLRGRGLAVRQDRGEADTIVVTGTNLRGARPTSPLITITRRDIDRTGATSVEQLMRIVPQNSQGGVNQENSLANVPGLEPTDHGAGLNLRGLGQRATLVLVNGRRLAPAGVGSFVDVSLIPISAVQRVEILTDGASAIYGSDAIGGVVNFILRDRLSGIESAVQVGTSTRGGGEQLQASLAGGRDWGSGRALVAYEFRLEDEIRAEDRDFTINLRPSTFLLPRERRHSLFGTVDQELGAGLGLGLQASWARRNTYRTNFISISPLPVDVDAEAEAVSVAGDLRYELPGGFLLRLDANYGLVSTAQQQAQPGGITLVNARDIRSAIMEFGARLDGPLLDLPAGPVRLALGALTRREEYREEFRSSELPDSGNEAERTVRSLFGELLVPLFSPLNRRSGLERLEISAAARYERYTGTGSTFDPKLGMLWSPLDGLVLRGSYSTSFRAPLLSEISGAYNAIYLPAFSLYVDPSQAPPGDVALFLQGSDPDVRPETSRTWTFGGEWSPGFAPALTLTANYYDIRFRNRIAIPTAFVVVIGNPAFEPIVDRTPDSAAVAAIVAGAQLVLDASGPGFSNGGSTPADVDIVLDDRFTNSAVTSTRGFDLGLRYGFDLGGNEFLAELNLNHIIDFEDQLTVASPVIPGADRPYRPPDWRGRGGLSWSRRGWAGSLFVNHAGDYLDDRTAALRRIDAHTTLDASLAYTFEGTAHSWLRGTRIALFAENLLDNAPPRLVPDPETTRGLGYDPVNASGRGRFIALQVRRTW